MIKKRYMKFYWSHQLPSATRLIKYAPFRASEYKECTISGSALSELRSKPAQCGIFQIGTEIA